MRNLGLLAATIAGFMTLVTLPCVAAEETATIPELISDGYVLTPIDGLGVYMQGNRKLYTCELKLDKAAIPGAEDMAKKGETLKLAVAVLQSYRCMLVK